jgi:pimeloyl-ACP methyl ester carboxylesterase
MNRATELIDRPDRRTLLSLGALMALGSLAGCAVSVNTPSQASGAGGVGLDDHRRTVAEGVIQRQGGVEFVEADWLDEARGRPVPVRLYLPESRAARVPLLVFSHGLGGSRRGYSYIGTHLARNGWASLHVQHVGSDRRLWAGSAWSLPARLQAAAQEAEAIDRVMDMRFALDRLMGAGVAADWPVKVDPARIVVAGHSYGANTALLMAGAQVEREDRALDLRDLRVAAAILLSAPPFHGEKDMAPILRPIHVPTLHITATDDDIRVPGYTSSVRDRLAVFEATGSQTKVLAVFRGGSHSMFTDRRLSGGAELNPQVKRATQDLVLAFTDKIFGQTGVALAEWPQRYREITGTFIDRVPSSS